jgi:heme/copper-type cytochrome/quinol oxidase subunit 4
MVLGMTTYNVNRISGRILVALSTVAFATVLTGYLQQPQLDEGAGAHIFQLSVVALMPTLVVFLTTADWKEPRRSLGLLATAGTLLVAAFGALYYLEHYFW